MARGLRCFTRIKNINGEKKNRVIPEARRPIKVALPLSTSFLSIGGADTIERPGSNADTVLLSARLYASKGSPASFDGGSGRVLSVIADLDRPFLRNGGGFIPDDFLIKLSFAFIGEAESLPNLVVEEVDREAPGCLPPNPPMVFCSRQINQDMSLINIQGKYLCYYVSYVPNLYSSHRLDQLEHSAHAFLT